MELDGWQKQVMKTKGNICLRSGRQVGKTEVISQLGADYAANNDKKVILIIASVERQAQLLFERLLGYMMSKYSSSIKRGKFRPTKHKLMLKNGSVIHCLPTGLTGYGIRGYTVDLLIADEAAFIPEEVWTAVTPMLAVRRGRIILLSTPHGKGGYYHSCFTDQHFTSFHVSSEDCPRKDQHFLDREKLRMTKVQYAQEYLGEFVDELMQFFPDKLVKKLMTLSRRDKIFKERRYYLGVDVARLGADESVFAILEKIDDKLIHVDNQITVKQLLSQTTQHILSLEKHYNFRRIYIDDGGIGVGVYDFLLVDPLTKRKVIPINNAQRVLDSDEKRKKKLLKEDLYNNLLMLMEQGRIELLDDAEIALSFKSVQYEYIEGKLGRGHEMRIYGNYTHCVEALIRAAWSMRDKTLNSFIM